MMKIELTTHDKKPAFKILSGYRAGNYIESKEGCVQHFQSTESAIKWAEEIGYEIIIK
ncbi:hypothetical protein ACUYQI_000528 [Salmonella enterica subsp. enterica serovar Braenderup]